MIDDNITWDRSQRSVVIKESDGLKGFSEVINTEEEYINFNRKLKLNDILNGDM